MKKKIMSAALSSALVMSAAAAVMPVQVMADDLVEIIWQWPSVGSTNEGFQVVEDKLNEMMEPEIGVHVTLEPVSFSNLANETVLAASSGEQLDLCLSVGSGVGSLVSSGLIEPLDDIIEEHGAAILEKCGDAMAGGYYNGELYGMPNAYIQGESYGYVARADLMEKYGYEYDENKLWTMDEFTEMFATIKAGEGDNFFCTIPEPTNEEALSRVAFEFDKLGATAASGYLMLNEDFTNTKIENVFATKAYEEYAQLMYDWAAAGYISRDAATNTETRESLVMGGNYLGFFTWSTPNVKYSCDVQCGYEMNVLKVVDAYTAGDRFQNILWSVPITSVNPEKAVEALNFIYEHDDAAWLLQYGIEGQDYEVVEKNDQGTIIRYLSEDPSTLPYFQPFGVYGDRLAWPLMDPSPISLNADLRAFSDNIPAERKSPALGYCFNYSNVSTEYSAVQAVIQQYVPSINCGTIDPAENLPEFIKALQDAGIDKTIEENQAQLDAWLAEQ